MAGPQRPRGSVRLRRVADVRGPDVGALGRDERLGPSGPPRGPRAALYARSAAGGDEVFTRQLASARTVLPAGAVIVGVFADVCAWDGWPPDPATITTAPDDPSICTG